MAIQRRVYLALTILTREAVALLQVHPANVAPDQFSRLRLELAEGAHKQIGFQLNDVQVDRLIGDELLEVGG